jgi:hypothetical protein
MIHPAPGHPEDGVVVRKSCIDGYSIYTGELIKMIHSMLLNRCKQ